MRASRQIPFVFVALGMLGCTAILGSFDVGTGTGVPEGGTAEAGEGGKPGDGGSDVSSDSPLDSPVSCTTPKVACGTECADLDTSDKNCGACGRSCLGGTCSARTCKEFVLVARTDVIPNTLTATDTDVFFATTANDVVQQPVTVGAAPIKLASRPAQVFSVAALPPALYFTTATVGGPWEAWKATIGAAGSGAMRNTGLTGRPVGLVAVATGGNLFTLDATNGPEAFRLTTCKAGTPACFSNYPGTRPGNRIVAGNGNVFWTDESSNSVFATLDGVGLQKTVSSVEGSPSAPAWDGADLFWLSNSTGKIRRSPYPAVGAAEFRDLGGTAADDLLVDATFVYYSQFQFATNTSELLATPKAGAAGVAPTRLATGDMRPLAQTAAGIYWADATGIHGVRKP